MHPAFHVVRLRSTGPMVGVRGRNQPLICNNVTVVFIMDLPHTRARLYLLIIESVDSISRDGPDTPIYIIHYKKRNNSEQEKFKAF